MCVSGLVSVAVLHGGSIGYLPWLVRFETLSHDTGKGHNSQAEA